MSLIIIASVLYINIVSTQSASKNLKLMGIKYPAICLAVASALTLCSCVCRTTISVNGPLVSKEFTNSAFDKVEVGDQFNVNITQGEKHSVNVSVPKELMDYVKCDVANGTLNVSLSTPCGYSIKDESLKCKVNITMPSLLRVNVHDQSLVTVNFPTLTKLEIQTADQSSLNLFTKTGSMQDLVLSASDQSSIMTDDDITVNFTNIEANDQSSIRVNKLTTQKFNSVTNDQSSLTLTALFASKTKLEAHDQSSTRIIKTVQCDNVYITCKDQATIEMP